MAVELHTSLPSHFLPDDDDHDDIVSSQHSHRNDIHHALALNPLPEVPMNDNDDDFISELTHRMTRFLLPDDDTSDFSSIGSHSMDLENSSRDSKHSPEDSGSSQEASPPATPEERCWKIDMIGTFEKMKPNETGNFNNQFQNSNTGLYSYQSLIREQIRAIELSGVKQEHVAVSPKPKSNPRRKSQAQEANKGNGRRARPPQVPHQGGAGMRALFLDGSGSRGGTGVFLPRGGGATTPSESTNKQGKGCSTVLIPARVVQALQLHFDQMAATSGPKAGGFPPLHGTLFSTTLI
ncbi:hypothetical protein D0Y65_032589 [Glycine soja]|uniref:Uncharacterized protein n=1 Tax=Glycine soja TaxID=3848 RepID=A0A445IDY2_GLYSO|nr:hypothetical protein D0Y65_032589 [Glycine soja]